MTSLCYGGGGFFNGRACWDFLVSRGKAACFIKDEKQFTLLPRSPPTPKGENPPSIT